MEKQTKQPCKNIMKKFGWGLIAIACITKYISASTEQDYVNAPSRQNVEKPSSDATYQEDIKSTDTLDCVSWTALISGAACLFLSTKKQKTK